MIAKNKFKAGYKVLDTDGRRSNIGSDVRTRIRINMYNRYSDHPANKSSINPTVMYNQNYYAQRFEIKSVAYDNTFWHHSLRILTTFLSL